VATNQRLGLCFRFPPSPFKVDPGVRPPLSLFPLVGQHPLGVRHPYARFLFFFYTPPPSCNSTWRAHGTLFQSLYPFLVQFVSPLKTFLMPPPLGPTVCLRARGRSSEDVPATSWSCRRPPYLSPRILGHLYRSPYFNFPMTLSSLVCLKTPTGASPPAFQR